MFKVRCGGLVRTQTPGCHPRVSESEVSAGAHESVFLRRSQGLMLRGPGTTLGDEE